MIVLPLPGFNDNYGISQGVEDFTIEQLIS
jgi:hypothetical protein